MDLKGSEQGQLRDALVDGFPWVELTALAQIHLDFDLASITDKGEGTKAAAWKLIQWAKQNGRLAALVEGALAENPGNPKVQALQRLLQSSPSAAPSAADPLEAWLTHYGAKLKADYEKRLKNSTWSRNIQFMQTRVRERPQPPDRAPSPQSIPAPLVSRAIGGDRSAGRAEPESVIAAPDKAPTLEGFSGTLEQALDVVKPRMALVADGGAGKTTILLRLAASMAEEAVRSESAPIPLYMRLNFFDASERAFDGFVDEMSRSSGLEGDRLRRLFSGERPCCLLLDGLNEVRLEYRGSCISAIERVVDGRHRVIVTSRPTAEVDELVRRVAPATVLDIVPLSAAEVREALKGAGLDVLAERLGDRLETLDTPFLVSAVIATFSRSTAGARGATNIARMYQGLIEDSIFREREQASPEDVRPTTYDYDCVKKPILSRLALEMRARNLTRLPEDIALKFIRAELKALADAFDCEKEVMPSKPIASRFVDEVVLNGLMIREGQTLEFWHESVLDFYAGIALSARLPEEIASLIDPLVWRRLEPSTGELPLPGKFTEALAMLVGLSDAPAKLLEVLAARNPLVAARCVNLAALHADPAGLALVRGWVAELGRSPARRWVACQCLKRIGSFDEATASALVQVVGSSREHHLDSSALRALSACGYAAPLVALLDRLLKIGTRAPTSVEALPFHSAIGARILVERYAAADSELRETLGPLIAELPSSLRVSEILQLSGAAREQLEARRERPRDRPSVAELRQRTESTLAAAEEEARSLLASSGVEAVRARLSERIQPPVIGAIRVLEQIGALSADALVDCLVGHPTTRSRRIHKTVSEALSRRPREEAWASWIAALERVDETPEARRTVVTERLIALAPRFGDAALPVLERFDRDDRDEERSAMLAALGAIATDAAFAKLGARVDAGRIEEALIDSLLASKHPESSRVLLSVLDRLAARSDAELGLAASVARALHQRGLQGELEARVASLLGSAEAHARLVAATALEEHADRAERPPSPLLLLAARDASPPVRAIGMRLLARIPGEAARSVLLRACIEETDLAVRIHVYESFRLVSEDADVEALVEASRSADVRIRRSAVAALATLPDEAILPHLESVAADPDPWIRAVAAKGRHALGETLPTALLEEIAAITVTAPDPETRAAAADVLIATGELEPRVYRPIMDALDRREYRRALDLIGTDKPFLEDLNTYFWRAMARDAIGDLVGALADYAAAGRLGASNAPRMMAQVEWRLGRKTEALARARALVADHPTDGVLQCELCDFSMMSGLLDEALIASEIAVKLEPDDLGIASSRAFALILRDGEPGLAGIREVVARAETQLPALRVAVSRAQMPLLELVDVWPDRRPALESAIELLRALDPDHWRPAAEREARKPTDPEASTPTA